MTAILADVIRLEVPTQAEITGGSPPAVKLKQQIHALDTGVFYYKNSSGTLVPFFPATLFSSQASALLGSGLIGDVGVTGVTPSGGALSGPGTVHALLIGLKNYVDATFATNVLTALFGEWGNAVLYSQNAPVWFVYDGFTYLAISNIPGDGTNVGNNPSSDIVTPGSWTVYGTTDLPLAQIITMILNTKANA